MAKTRLTKLCESALWKENARMGVFGCFEVSIGWEAKEIVDFITYKTNNEFRCYEIKVSKADFHSKAKLSFVGDYNYYVMPISLYKELRLEAQKQSEKDEWFKGDSENIFDTRMKNSGIGLYIVSENGLLTNKISAKRKNVSHGMKSTLLESMVRSLNREVKKFYRIAPYWGLDINQRERPNLIGEVL
jgi:hypothetical protein